MYRSPGLFFYIQTPVNSAKGLLAFAFVLHTFICNLPLLHWKRCSNSKTTFVFDNLCSFKWTDIKVDFSHVRAAVCSNRDPPKLICIFHWWFRLHSHRLSLSDTEGQIKIHMTTVTCSLNLFPWQMLRHKNIFWIIMTHQKLFWKTFTFISWFLLLIFQLHCLI